MSHRILRGTLTGLMVWMLYAAFEYIFGSLAATARNPDPAFAAWYWKLTVELVVAYAVIGAISGAIIGAVFNSERAVVGAAILTVL